MSYLNPPRLTFAGTFQADVNTVNNDVRNYDSAVFEPRFQDVQVPAVPQPLGSPPDVFNGWWNPDGSNSFTLLDCTVTGAVAPTGAASTGDPVLGLNVESQRNRTAAKLVDLDPQFQFASAIWGLRLSLASGGRTLLSATLVPTPFRDIYFGRIFDRASGKSVPGSPSASARFTGALEELVWGEGAEASPVLAALKASAEAHQGRLALSLMTYSYNKTRETTSFTLGSLIGSIGPWFQGEPLTFAPGRRLAPMDTSPNWPFASAAGIGFLTAAASAELSLLSLDFGNALPMWQLAPPGNAPAALAMRDIGPLQVAVLTRQDTVPTDGTKIVPAASEGEVLPPGSYVPIGTLQSYDLSWLTSTGGLVDMAVPEAARALLADHPIVITTPNTSGEQTVALRETLGGFWVRADDFIQRVDAAETGWVNATATLYAMRYGQGWSGVPITLTPCPKLSDQGGTDDTQEKDPPKTSIPDINTPAEKLAVSSPAITGQGGVATLHYQVANPANVRGYLDGQLYQLQYSLSIAGESPMPVFEMIVVHVRDAYTPPATPVWEKDVAPVLQQYGNLYPIMSKGLFSFSAPDTVAAHARLLRLAFTRRLEDPNHMPVTRDLSAGKRHMLVRWLSTFLPDEPPPASLPPLPEGKARVLVTAPAPTLNPSGFTPEAARRAVQALGVESDGKTNSIRAFLKHTAGLKT